MGLIGPYLKPVKNLDFEPFASEASVSLTSEARETSWEFSRESRFRTTSETEWGYNPNLQISNSWGLI